MAQAKYLKIIAENRKARHDYNILAVYKVGLVLKGGEVKSIRNGKANLKESFGRVENQEVWLHGIHISPYSGSKLDPIRPRKALLNKRELMKLIGKVAEKGLTLVPLKLYFEGNWAKIDLGLAKAKRTYEKRETIRRRETEKEIETAFKGKVRGS
ncbi:MAG: SsrA-binding protein SmpB [bacterium]